MSTSTAPAVTVSAVATLPPVVTGLTATPGNGRITLTWTNPTDNNVKEVEMSYTDPRPGDNNGTTVGTSIEVSHVKASKPGTTISAEAELICVDGRKLTFRVSASEGSKTIGEGTHTRYVVEKETFLAKL